MVSNLIVRPVVMSDMTNFIRILGQAFVAEPMLKYAGLQAEEPGKLVELLSDNIIEDELSMIAETEDGTPVAGSMALDFGSVMNPKVFHYVFNHPHYSQIYGIIRHLEEHYCKIQGFDRGTFPLGHSVHLILLGTVPDFCRQGIASKVRSAALDHYRVKNYKYAVSEATSLFTKKLSYKFGFKCALKVPYTTWFPEGSIYSKSVNDGHDSVELLIKEL